LPPVANIYAKAESTTYAVLLVATIGPAAEPVLRLTVNALVAFDGTSPAEIANVFDTLFNIQM
jgi:hypothetical protein